MILPEQQEHHPGGRAGRRQTDEDRCAVVPTRGIAEGFAALLAYDPEAARRRQRQGDDRGGRARRGRRGHPGGPRLDLRRSARSPRATASASPATASGRSAAGSTGAATGSCSTALVDRRPRDRHASSRARARRRPTPATSPSGSHEHRPDVDGRGPPRRPAALPVPLRHRVAPAAAPIGPATLARARRRCPSPSSKGVGPKRAEALAKLDIADRARPAHLLPAPLPRPHATRRRIDELDVGEEAMVLGRRSTRVDGAAHAQTGKAHGRRRRHRRHRATCGSRSSTSRGASGSCSRARRRCCSARSRCSAGARQMTNPVVDLVGDKTGRIVPVYPQSEKAGVMTVGRRQVDGRGAATGPASSPTRCRPSVLDRLRPRRPHRRVPRHPHARVDGRGRARPGAGSCSTSCCACSSRSCCASARSSARRHGHPPRRRRRARAALPRARCRSRSPAPRSGSIGEIDATTWPARTRCTGCCRATSAPARRSSRSARCSSPCRAATRAR